MSFSDTINTLPFAPRTQHGSGFLPPILRAATHVIYLLGCINDERVEVAPEEALAELNAAREHFGARVQTQNISTVAIASADTLASALVEAVAEYPDWTAEQATTNLRNLANRIMQFAASLDRELVGLRESDPGSTL